MKLDNRTIIEFIGLAGIIGSLIFVGIQLQLETRVALADQYFARAESRMATFRSNLESDHWIENEIDAWDKGDRPAWWNESLELQNKDSSSRDIVLRILRGSRDSLLMDSMHYQYQQGLIPEEYWLGAREQIKNILKGELGRVQFKRLYRADFHELLDEILLEIENEQ